MNAQTEPVLIRTLAAAVIGLIATALGTYGVSLSAGDKATATTAAVGIITVALHVYAGWRARRRVTPTAAPRSAEGLPLVTHAAAGTLDAGAPPDVPLGADEQPPTVPETAG